MDYNTSESKKCGRCKEILPISDIHFRKSKRYKDGLFNWCKKCEAIYKKEYAQKNKDKISAEKKKYYQENKEAYSKRNKEYRENNKEYVAEYLKEYYETNKEEIAKYKKKHQQDKREHYSKYLSEYYKNNKEKYAFNRRRRESLKKDLPSSLTPAQWEEIKGVFNNKCCYCGKKRNLAQDHFVPLSKGGEYTHNNIVPACKSCNSSKRASAFSDWYPQQDFYSVAREHKILSHLNYKDNIQQLSIL